MKQCKKNTYYITTPIYYPNASPHIGSLYSTLIADIIARYQKLFGKKVVFLTGVDEHGQKIAEAAAKKNMQPKEFVDSISALFQEAWKKWNIDYTIFMKTSSDFHKEGVTEWIIRMEKEGFIYKALYEGWYSVTSEAFLTEKDAECKNKHDVPICPLSGKEAIWLSQDAYFFKLSSFQKPLLEWYAHNPEWIYPKERINEVVEFVKGGLKDLCISRTKENLLWSIDYPGDAKQGVYVWADALNNYITGVGYPSSDQFCSIWPADVHVLAKDIIRFHAVYWPAFLMASKLPLPKKLLVHGWLLVDNKKMSKSLGNVISPEHLQQQYGVDRMRYYFARHIALTHDSSFSDEDIIQKTNAECVNTLGNLVQRVIMLALQNNLDHVDILASPLQEVLLKEGDRLVQFIEQCINECSLTRACEEIWKYISFVNQAVQESQPWAVVKKDKNEFTKIISALLQAIARISYCVSPIMPQSAETILFCLYGQNCSIESLENNKKVSFRLTAPSKPLFERLELQVKEKEKDKNRIKNIKSQDNHHKLSR